MSPITYTTYTLEYNNSTPLRPVYESCPEQVAFQIKGNHQPSDVEDQSKQLFARDVMITSTWSSGAKHTETLSAEVARQLWKQWVDKGYNRVVPIGGGWAMLSNPYHKVLNNP